MINPDFWSDVGTFSFETEADVETRLVLPLLQTLGYSPNNIRSKQAIDFQMGREKRRGRKPEADFVVYGGEPHGRATSLMVVEAKRPSESLDDALKQAESYASAVRAPIVMLTNGKSIELWQLQPAGENTLAFRASIGELASKRGQLEMIGGVGAVTVLCGSLTHKRLDLVSDDITALEQHEHGRLGPEVGEIRRTLSKKNSLEKTTSDALLEECPRGAIILGPSGYGKSTLAAMLVREAIETRWESRRDGLTFELFLPDVANYSGGLDNYLFERASRHLAALTLRGLQDLIRRRGVTIVADALERVGSAARDGLFSALRIFARDYPRTQIFLMSRYADSRAQELNLPEFELDPYSAEDFQTLLRAKGIVEPEHFGRVSAMPEHLTELCREPLIADLVTRYLAAHSQYPTHIGPLYEEWLQHLFRGFDPIQKLTLRVLLSDIAVHSTAAAIQFETARELALVHGQAADVLTKLTDANAIVIRGSTFEISHQALADYLRALNFLQSAGADVENQVQLIDFEATSQFPRLLLAAARTPREELAIWRAIVRKDLVMGIDALQFTHGGGTASLADEDLQTRVLSDLLDGYDTVVEAHFTRLRSELASSVAGRPINILGVAGAYSDAHASYCFVSVNSGEARVLLKEDDNPSIAYGMDLAALGYQGDGGRVLGVSAVTSGLSSLLTRRALLGGRVFTKEIVLGRLRHLVRQYKIPLTAPYGLREVKETLLPMAQNHVRPDAFRSGQTFRISEVLVQIDFLLEAGITELREWCDIGKMDLSIPEHKSLFAAQLHELYLRRQQAYLEIVEQSFPTLRSSLLNAIQVPHRVMISVDPDTEPFNRISINYREVPVETIEEAGAAVSFPTVRSDWTKRSAVEAHHQENQGRLASLKTARANYVSHTGWANFHGFFVSRWDGSGNADETAVTRDVTKWLQSDFKRVFDRLPGLSRF